MNPQVCTWLVINSCCAAHPDGIIGILISNDVYCGERDMAREVDSKNPTPPYGTGILFEEPNPTGSRPRGLIGLYKRWHQEERPQPAKRSNREEGGGDFIQEGNRAPVSKATHERGSFKRESVFFRRYASSRFWTTSKRNQTLRGLLTTALLSSTL